VRVWMTCIALLGAGAVYAQEPPRQDGPRAGRARHEELFRMVDAYIFMHMQERLELSDEQFVKVLPLVKRLQSDRRDWEGRRMRALQRLRRLLVTGTATEAQVGEVLAELKAVEAEMPRVLQRDVDALDGALTPLQQAKYRVLEIEVEQRLRDLRNAARLRGGAGNRLRRGMPQSEAGAESR
jgi:hypothetical protein